MQVRKALLAALVAAMPLVLGGCFEIKEEIAINADGSGRIVIDIGVDKTGDQSSPEQKAKDEAKSKKQKEDLEKDPNVTKVEMKRFKEGKLDHESMDVSVKDVTKLGAVLDKIKDPKSKSEDVFELKKLPNGNYSFVQTFGRKTPPADAKEPTPEQKKAQKEQIEKIMGDHKVELKLTGPSIVSSNGTNKGATAEWSVKLAQIMEDETGKGVEFKAEIGAK